MLKMSITLRKRAFLWLKLITFASNYIQFSHFMNTMPPVTKNLLIINVLAFASTYVAGLYGIDLKDLLGLHFFLASDFRIYQIVTYMFMHAGLEHLFFNMFAVWMFGRIMEQTFGARRYLIYYFVCGIGAGFLQEIVQYFSYLSQGFDEYSRISMAGITMEMSDFLNRWTTVGASGAVYGILLAFGWFFPDVRMFILFIPIPIRARTLVVIYALIELFTGIAPTAGDNVAHFAHLGGMIFGWILILWWRFRGCEGFYAPEWRIMEWIKEKWAALFPKRHPRIKRDDDSKDYRDYHYHGSI